MRFEVITDVGAGPLRFGMTRSEVSTVLARVPEPFFKTEDSPEATDDFGFCHVYYRAGRCEAIEFFEQADLRLDGARLFGRLAEIAALIRRPDERAVEDGCGLTSLELGLALYCPAKDQDEDARVKSVLVFERGYYDR